MKHDFFDVACLLEMQFFEKLLSMKESGQSPPWESKETKNFGSTAVVPIFGIIDSDRGWYGRYAAPASEIVPLLEKYAADPAVKNILILMDTPGGSSKANRDISYAVKKAADAKPIETFVDGLCCSAGLYIASHTNKVTATPGSTVGSIGTIATYYDTSKLFSSWGVEPKVLTTAPMKSMGLPGVEITDEQISQRMEIIRDLTDDFKLVIRERRKLSAEQVDKLADGNIWLAPKAKDKGLIDAVEHWDTFCAAMKDTAKATAPKAAADLVQQPQEGKKIMDPKEREAAIVAACPGLDREKNASFLLDALLSTKEPSEIGAEWKDHLHKLKIDELTAQNTKLQEALDSKDKPALPGGKPVGVDQKEESPGMDPKQCFEKAIAGIQKEYMQIEGKPLSRSEASRQLVETEQGAKIMKAYTDHCETLNPNKFDDGLKGGAAPLRIGE